MSVICSIVGRFTLMSSLPFLFVFTPHMGGLVAYPDKFIDEAMSMQFAWFGGVHDDAFLDDGGLVRTEWR